MAGLGSVPGRIGFLGPAGTHTEEALRSQPDLATAEAVPYPTVEDAIAGVAEGAIEAAVVPVENSIEGSVNVTLDLLASGTELRIRREIVVPVDLALVAAPGTAVADVVAVVSHPHAIAQCRRTIGRLMPDARMVPASSTSEAVAAVAAGEGGEAAIGTHFAADLYSAAVLVDDVADHTGAETRFLLLGRGIPPRTGADKTSLLCHLSEDRPGSLLAILQEFAARGLNLTKVESRPTKSGLGEYFFFIDVEGHLADALIQDALRGLEYRFGSTRFLGSYPRARRGGLFHEEEEEAAWARAGAWVDVLKAQIEP